MRNLYKTDMQVFMSHTARSHRIYVINPILNDIARMEGISKRLAKKKWKKWIGNLNIFNS